MPSNKLSEPGRTGQASVSLRPGFLPDMYSRRLCCASYFMVAGLLWGGRSEPGAELLLSAANIDTRVPKDRFWMDSVADVPELGQVGAVRPARRGEA